MNAKQIFQSTKLQLLKNYTEGEAESVSYLLLEHYFALSRIDVLMEKEIAEVSHPDFETALERLLNDEPVQYVIGRTEFYGRSFLVNPNVLIPRPETEELVHLIITRHAAEKSLKILDIGTGSGIIPITLAKELDDASLYAVDISGAALATARRNALLNHAEVNFLQLDILLKEPDFGKFDIWVSNPPYVCDAEKDMMLPRVLEHEPAQALFVKDTDPLVFYRRIAQLATKHLKPKAYLYFEINEAFGPETALLLNTNGFEEIEIYKDMQGKDRIVCAQLKA